MRNVMIGQYLPTGSAAHRLDPRAKILIAVLLMTGAVATRSLVCLLLTLSLVLGGLVLARIPLGYVLRSLRPALPWLLLLALLQVVAIPQNNTGTLLWQKGWIVITTQDLRMAALVMLRFAVLILLINLFSLITSTTDLTHGIEGLMRPLQRLGLPGHELALVLVVALRFVPLLAMEAERLAKAQAARGADVGAGRMNPLRRARRMLPLLVPLFVTALRRAETLALAMEARGYTGGRGRTHLIRLQARMSDVGATLAVALFAALLIGSAWIDIDIRFCEWLNACRLFLSD